MVGARGLRPPTEPARSWYGLSPWPPLRDHSGAGGERHGDPVVGHSATAAASLESARDRAEWSPARITPGVGRPRFSRISLGPRDRRPPVARPGAERIDEAHPGRRGRPEHRPPFPRLPGTGRLRGPDRHSIGDFRRTWHSARQSLADPRRGGPSLRDAIGHTDAAEGRPGNGEIG